MAIINGITVQEMREGFEEGVHDQGPTATKKYLCDWADRFRVANGLLGFSTGAGSGGSITMTSPMLYPESANLYAREITIEGKGKATQGPVQIQFAQAVVTVNYGVSSWGPAPLPDMSIDPGMPFVYATQELDFAREMVTIPKSAVTLANGNKLKDLPYAFPIVQAIMTIGLQRVPYLPAAQVVTAMQRPLNSTTFLGVAPGYLMFNGCKSHRENQSDGSYTQNLTLVFAYRPVLRWDEVFDPNGTSGPQQVRYNGAAILLRSNLATLIPAVYGGAGP